eukprot:GDKI01021709.1.p3 GENE.GDKI01021709.1~~GDKI01021709.1.p3  ORF type:complete len:108 (+),score=22.12 GDKI01021709.1:590-913(+)
METPSALIRAGAATVSKDVCKRVISNIFHSMNAHLLIPNLAVQALSLDDIAKLQTLKWDPTPDLPRPEKTRTHSVHGGVEMCAGGQVRGVGEQREEERKNKEKRETK